MNNNVDVDNHVNSNNDLRVGQLDKREGPVRQDDHEVEDELLP